MLGGGYGDLPVSQTSRSRPKPYSTAAPRPGTPEVDAAPETRRVVAIQPKTILGEVEANLARIEDLVNSACREHSPDIVFLPESMTTPNLYHRAMRAAARPVDGQPYQMLQRLARRHGCMVGGGYIALRGRDTRGTYCLMEPDGTAHFHDKDEPSMWENNYYSGGSDDGVVQTALGPIGLACGWEYGRVRTVNRLAGRVRLLGGGMFFAGYPTWKATAPYFRKREQELMLQYARETPPRMARMLGVAVAHPSHVGDYAMETMLVPGLPWRSDIAGETQICERDGRTLGRLSYADGEGYIAADVTLAAPTPIDPTPDTFWNASFPISAHLVWYLGKSQGRTKYEAMKRLRLHRWQRWPATDLPNRVDAIDLAAAEAASKTPR
jgi:Carbon-nitrogen hydrolase